MFVQLYNEAQFDRFQKVQQFKRKTEFKFVLAVKLSTGKRVWGKVSVSEHFSQETFSTKVAWKRVVVVNNSCSALLPSRYTFFTKISAKYFDKCFNLGCQRSRVGGRCRITASFFSSHTSCVSPPYIFLRLPTIYFLHHNIPTLVGFPTNPNTPSRKRRANVWQKVWSKSNKENCLRKNEEFSQQKIQFSSFTSHHTF